MHQLQRCIFRRKFNMSKDTFITIHNQFSIIYRHGKMMHDRAVSQFGLTGQQMGYMKMIHDNPGISQEEIVRITRIDKGAVAKSIRDMVDKGYVVRDQNPEDKRAYCLSLTDKAEVICREGDRHCREFEKMLSEGLSEEETELFGMLLEKIITNMEKIIAGGEK